MTMKHLEPIAHLSEDDRHHLLYDHLTGAARRAAEMAAEFGCRGWGRVAGDPKPFKEKANV